MRQCKSLLIQMACTDALARLRDTKLQEETEEIWTVYFDEQNHLRLIELLKSRIEDCHKTMEHSVLLQVTTHSLSLAPIDIVKISKKIALPRQNILDISLEEIETQSDFADKIRYTLNYHFRELPPLCICLNTSCRKWTGPMPVNCLTNLNTTY